MLLMNLVDKSVVERGEEAEGKEREGDDRNKCISWPCMQETT